VQATEITATVALVTDEMAPMSAQTPPAAAPLTAIFLPTSPAVSAA
jgi:hypothetical protein